MAEGSMRGNHAGASFIPIEDQLGAALSPLLAYGQTAQSTNDEWLGKGRKGIKPIRGTASANLVCIFPVARIYLNKTQ